MLKFQLPLLGVLAFLIGTITPATAQTKLTLLNGSSFNVSVIDDSDISIRYSKLNEKGKVQYGEMHKFRLFSITPENGSEEILYNPDVEAGDFTIDEMRSYMRGEVAAQQHKPIWPFLQGAALGAASYYALGDSYLLLGVPLAATVSASFTGPIFVKRKKDPQSPFNDKPYSMGYKRVAKQKKVMAVLKGTLAGIASGFVTAKVVSAIAPSPAPVK